MCCMCTTAKSNVDESKAQLYIALKLCNTQERKFTAAKKICAIYHFKSSPWELLVIKITKGGANLEFRISDKQAWAGANLDRSQSLFLICTSGNLRDKQARLERNIRFLTNEENCWLYTLDKTSDADKVKMIVSKYLQAVANN